MTSTKLRRLFYVGDMELVQLEAECRKLSVEGVTMEHDEHGFSLDGTGPNLALFILRIDEVLKVPSWSGVRNGRALSHTGLFDFLNSH